MSITVITNNVPRDVVDAWELSAAERAEFDYLNWDAIDDGRDSHSFLRYRGALVDLDEFEVWHNPLSATFGTHWDAIRPDSYFSGLVVRYLWDEDPNGTIVVVGRYYS